MKELISLGLFAISCLGSAAAQEMSEEEYLAALEDSLPGTLLNNPLNPEWTVHGEDASKKVVKADIPGQQAYRVKVARVKSNSYDVAVQGNVRDGIAAGDVILVAFWARAHAPDKETGSGHLEFRLQKNASPYTGIVEGSVFLREDWQIHYLNGTATQDYAPGEANVSFNIGHHKQTVELGQYYIMDMGPGTDPASLPSGSVDP